MYVSPTLYQVQLLEQTSQSPRHRNALSPSSEVAIGCRKFDGDWPCTLSSLATGWEGFHKALVFGKGSECSPTTSVRTHTPLRSANKPGGYAPFSAPFQPSAAVSFLNTVLSEQLAKVIATSYWLKTCITNESASNLNDSRLRS